MRIGVPRERDSEQTLVAASPDTVKKLIKLGYEVVVEKGAGAKASFPDSQYEEAGAQIVDETVWSQSDIITVLDTPPAEYIEQIPANTVLVSRLAPGRNPDLITTLSQRKLTALAMDAVPRISRAQSMDVLSSMANIAGYRAVIEAASNFGRLFTGQVTAAGKVPPATIYVIGAGVAGLAAIGTANSMGAIVKATDVRPEAGEQIESMGAEFVPIPAATEKSEDGYAKEMNEEQAKAAARLYSEQSEKADIIITTANIPGRVSPTLLTAADVEKMRPGSVIVDMAAANGGNCELTRAGEVFTTDNGVTIIGYTDLAGRLPSQASQLYGQNIVNLFSLITPNKDGQFTLDLEDEIIRGITVTYADPAKEAETSDILWPPPPVKVSAAPAAPKQEVAPVVEEVVEKPKSPIGKIVAALLGVGLIFASPLEMSTNYMILMLAVVVGFYVITAVTHSLHTPLMSETNAISGIILVGSVLQVGSANLVVSAMAFIAIVVASINIFGGFTVTHRMLDMFRGEA